MTVKSLLLILLGGVLANNYALQKFLGVTPFLGYGKEEKRIAGMGLAVTLVMVLTVALTWPVQTFVLATLRLEYLQTLVFVALILVVVSLVDLIAKKLLHKCLGVYFPLIALNSAVLGLAVNNVGAGYNFLESLVAALGVGLGFMLAMVLFSGVRSRAESDQIPSCFKGMPITLIAASIVAVAFMGFNGVVDGLFK